ncbi:hypothetical protein [Candidatus Nitrospira salsa]
MAYRVNGEGWHMAWEFIGAGLYLLGVLTVFVMTLTNSQCPGSNEDSEKPESKSDEVDYKKAA